MYKRFGTLTVWLLLVTLILTGCFRQASPDISPPISTLPPATQLPTDIPGDVTPFVTPFDPGAGPDTTSMPTLDPTATLALVMPGDEEPAAEATPGPETDAEIAPTQPAASGGAPPTVPFAAGPTYTPVPGAPPVNLNPNAPGTSGQAGAASAASGGGEDCVYTVQSGDTAFYIATLHGITLDQLIQYNRLDDANRLYQGQELKIPSCGEDTEPTSAAPAGPTSVIRPPLETPTDLIPQSAPDGSPIHVVAAGDNLFRIALRYGVSMESIVAANSLGSTEAILSVGQQLVIPVE